MTREFFASNGIRYTEEDIEQSSTALQQHRKLGGNGVPLIVVGDEVVKGWNEQALRQLLGPWLRS
jgi:glutaredoxin